MPPPTKYINRWEDIKDDVFEIIYNMKAPLSAEDKDQLVKAMRERGYNIGWNGLRYVILPFFFPSSFLRPQTIFCPATIEIITTTRLATDNMARKVTTWGAEQNLAALQAMYEWMNPSKQDMIEIALACRTKGHHFSGSALAFLSYSFTTTTTHTLSSATLHHHQTPTSSPTSPNNMPPGRALSGKPTTVWDHDAHLTLLQAVIVRGEIKAECWDAIIAYTNLRGYNYTQGAALHSPRKVADMAIDKSRMKWDLQANHDLLLCLVQELSPSQDQLRAVMEQMHELGYTCTVKAITQHLQKLRRKDTAANDGPAEGSSANAPETPAKTRGGKAAAKKTPGSNKRKDQAAAAGDNGTDNEEADPTPAAKKRRGVKKEAPKSDTIVKKEDSEDDHDSYGQPRAATTVYSADAS
ncbi:Putative protein of unknown function [Podospora comata]|uniref:Clr5 domain-containing protein n=1 Tax=Podospora comata TaxID=48703 RepID=A0ABY6SHN1_PODCO|nr:Putative protein of unknown function [Podospora comata]